MSSYRSKVKPELKRKTINGYWQQNLTCLVRKNALDVRVNNFYTVYLSLVYLMCKYKMTSQAG